MSVILSSEQMEGLRNAREIQGQHGNFDYNDYMLGMYNGMELMLSIIESREPAFRQTKEDDIMPDKLNELFRMQHMLDHRITTERNIQKSLSEWVIGLTIAMESEIDEIRREVNWKWWKNEKEIDKDALQGEIIDMWHFLISLSQKAGLSAEDVYRIYVEKNAENHARQSGQSTKEGYEVTS